MNEKQIHKFDTAINVAKNMEKDGKGLRAVYALEVLKKEMMSNRLIEDSD